MRFDLRCRQPLSWLDPAPYADDRNSSPQDVVWGHPPALRTPPCFSTPGSSPAAHDGIPDSEKFVALKKVRLLGQLDDAEVWELVHAGKWLRVPPRTAIVREGETGKSLFFLGSGQAKVTKQGRLLNVLDAGECVGEMAYVKEGGIVRQATVESMADVLLAEFEQEALDKVSLKCRYQLSLALMHSLVDRLTLADERVARAG